MRELAKFRDKVVGVTFFIILYPLRILICFITMIIIIIVVVVVVVAVAFFVIVVVVVVAFVEG